MLGSLAFLNPWLLAGLLALPLIYLLLRTVPPRPRQVAFPPTRILVGIENREKTPAKTPWWLLLIRLAAAAAVILALAEPVLNPRRDAALKGSGPVAIVVDNGWSAAPRWSQRLGVAERLIEEAESQGRPVVIVPTASTQKATTARVEPPKDARSSLAALQPLPFLPDTAAAASALEAALGAATVKSASVVWLTDGIDHGGKAREFADRLASLASGGTFAVVDDAAGNEVLGLTAGVGRDGKLEAAIRRATGGARDGVLHAFSVRSERLGEARFAFKPGETTTTAGFDLPLELRNQVARIEVAGQHSAGAVSLIDSRSQWHRIGVMSGEAQEQAQPLLAPLYYIEKALAPFAELIRPKDMNLAGGVTQMLEQKASVVVLADIGTLTGEVKADVEKWVDKGGVLVRFAGSRLEKGGDDLLPVPLRLGGRTLGGALSWSTPQPLAAFEQGSLFAGLTVPQEVTVNRQLLADPARIGPEVQVWARLKDGTPLVTAVRRGQGQIVLFHVTANSDWSNLPMSGLFVDMLRRIATLGRAGGVVGGVAVADTKAKDADAAPDQQNVLAPAELLDGFGILKNPPPTASPVTLAEIGVIEPSREHPPGYYGPGSARRALNVIGAKTELKPLPSLPSSAERRGYEGDTSRPLKPWLLALAVALILGDILAVLILQAGGLAGLGRQLGQTLRPGARASALLLACGLGVLALDDGAEAQTRPQAAQPPARTAPSKADDATAQKATGKVTLGYVLTGDGATDDASRSGLAGLCRILSLRTAIEPGEPLGVDILTDEIAFYPVLYWPVLPNARALPGPVLGKIDAYMKQGGMIIFDTRDSGSGIPTGAGFPGQGGTALQRLIGALDLPRLEPVPEGHVLTKSFYLLRSFPGRWDGGQLWVEASESSANPADRDSRKAQRADGVSSIIVTANDLASAWALDDRGRGMYPVVPGGEGQREMAFRTGVNIVMHALTGNYKADQVHVPALLERLGQ
jgi:hypothetical protein